MNRFSPYLLAAALALVALPSLAQDNPECLGSSCGKPKEEGGGCGCGCGCSVWVAYTDDGKTLAYTDDGDGDGKADDSDNCPFVSNANQADGDGDGVGDSCDNCSAEANLQQIDTDGDGKGDICDDDADGDTVANGVDNCRTIPNTNQADNDKDGIGDVCDPDDDNDGVPDITDTCPLVANSDQTAKPEGAVCNIDSDGDNVGDARDNCPDLANPTQVDTDGDDIGDACDNDIDNDGLLNAPALADNCPTNANANQLDDDGDGVGDACDELYCVVVDQSDKANCLNPKGPFAVSGGGHLGQTLKAGESIRLPLFANRNGAPIEFSWTVDKEKSPASSRAAVQHPTGVVTMSRHWAYAYPGPPPTFVADVDGDYTLQLSARLAVPDRAYPEIRTSVSNLTMNVNSGSSCSAIPVDGSLAGLGLALLALIRRRR